MQGDLRTPALFPTHGNQCALITGAHAPCYMERDGLAPDWRACGRNPAINGTYEYGIAEARRRNEFLAIGRRSPLPNYCGDCGAALMGGATEHKPGCALKKFIDENFPKGAAG